MKKILSILILVGSLCVMPFFSANTKAISQDNMEGDPSQNENHFIWDIMSQLQTPDDSDCSSVAQTTLLEEGISAGEASQIATEACQGIASMRENMESGMPSSEASQESIETNLWDATNWHAVDDLYFEHSTNGVADGKIAFSEPIDFMSYDFMNFMTNFGENMESREAYISLDADVVGGFANYGATLTMYNVPDFENPEILVDGGQDTEGIVSNINYDKDSDTMTFSAAHFTSFEAVEGNNTPDIDNVKVRKFLSSHGNEKVRVTAHGRSFDNGVKIKLGSRDPYEVNRDVKKGVDSVEAYFDLDDIFNSGQDDLIVHIINSGGVSADYEDKAELYDIKPLKIWEYRKVYNDNQIDRRLDALNFVYANSAYVRY